MCLFKRRIAIGRLWLNVKIPCFVIGVLLRRSNRRARPFYIVARATPPAVFRSAGLANQICKNAFLDFVLSVPSG